MNKMDVALDYIVRLWPVLLGFIGVIAWAVRAESKITLSADALRRIEKENTDQITRLETRIDIRRKEDMDRIDRSLDTISKDVKELLGRK